MPYHLQLKHLCFFNNVKKYFVDQLTCIGVKDVCYLSVEVLPNMCVVYLNTLLSAFEIWKNQ